MTPAAHYAEAERLLVKAADCVVASITRQLVQTAQVHATLASCAEPYHIEGWKAQCENEVGVGIPAPTSIHLIEPTGDRL